MHGYSGKVFAKIRLVVFTGLKLLADKQNYRKKERQTRSKTLTSLTEVNKKLRCREEHSASVVLVYFMTFLGSKSADA